MNTFQTICFLNFRAQPRIASETLISVLPKGEAVFKVSDAEISGWWKVEVPALNNKEGFISSKFVEPINAPPPQISLPKFPKDSKPHLTPKASTDSRRNSVHGRAFPLNEQGLPYRDISSAQSKFNSIYTIVDYLDVQNSKRYGPTSSSTFCNIYAYDFCYLNSVYLPRVWWMSKTISSIMSGNSLPVIYGQTVLELNANALFDWLLEFGDDFGWRRVYTMDELQDDVNQNGSIGIICAQNINSNHSGHISCVIPEDNQKGLRCKRENSIVQAPLQSQAGRNNFKTFSLNWWSNPLKFKGYGFWLND